VLVFGMDVGRLGGVFRVTRGLQEQFGTQRVFDTPLSEGAIIGASVGLAVGGLIPVPEIQFLGFTYQAFHQIGQQLVRFRSRSRGKYPMPVTIRAPSGGGLRTPEFHADAVEGQFAQMPGIKIACPAFPGDALTMLRLAIQDPDPVLFVEPQRLYRTLRGPVALVDGETSWGGARVVRPGRDVTLVAWSASVHLCLAAAQDLEERGVSAAVVDLRLLVPLDVPTLVEAVTQTGRAVVVHEGPTTGGFGAEVVATVQQEAFGSLQAPIIRVGAYDVPYPPGSLEDHYLPSAGRVQAAALTTLES
jgi:pyruvate dehydrogenase E1 component beta subunit